MTFKTLVKRLCQLEGKKRQVDIANMSEIVSSLKKLIKDDPIGVLKALL